MIVLKPLNCLHRRLKVGDPARPTDDYRPHTFADLKARGFIGEKEAPAHRPTASAKNIAPGAPKADAYAPGAPKADA